MIGLVAVAVRHGEWMRLQQVRAVRRNGLCVNRRPEYGDPLTAAWAVTHERSGRTMPRAIFLTLPAAQLAFAELTSAWDWAEVGIVGDIPAEVKSQAMAILARADAVDARMLRRPKQRLALGYDPAEVVP